MVKLGKTTGIKNEFVKGSDYELPNVGEHLPTLNFVCLAIGSSGSGKTTSCINLVKEYQKHKAFDTIVLISPTATANKETKSGFVPEQKFQKNLVITDIYEKLTSEVINDIKTKQNTKIDEYMTYLDDLKLYKRIMSEDKTVSDYEILQYYEKYGFKSPTCQYKHIPTLLIIADDITSSARLAILADLASKSRHYSASLMVLCQSLVQMSPTLRLQASVVLCFKTASKHVVDTLYEEMANSDMSRDEFETMMALPQEKKEFILINLKETDKNKRYRLNYENYLIPE